MKEIVNHKNKDTGFESEYTDLSQNSADDKAQQESANSEALDNNNKHNNTSDTIEVLGQTIADHKLTDRRSIQKEELRRKRQETIDLYNRLLANSKIYH